MVGRDANLSKGDRDASAWLPSALDGRCAYAARQVAVKARYELTVSTAERSALADTLGGCPGTRPTTVRPIALGGFPLAPTAAPTAAPKAAATTKAPTTTKPKPRVTTTPPAASHPRPVVAPRPDVKPRPATTPRPVTTTRSTSPSTISAVHPGAYCSPGGAFGHTSAGTLMQCKTSATDSRNRWRTA